MLFATHYVNFFICRKEHSSLAEELQHLKDSLLRDTNRGMDQQRVIDKMKAERRETICVQAHQRQELERDLLEAEKKVSPTHHEQHDNSAVAFILLSRPDQITPLEVIAQELSSEWLHTEVSSTGLKVLNDITLKEQYCSAQKLSFEWSHGRVFS